MGGTWEKMLEFCVPLGYNQIESAAISGGRTSEQGGMPYEESVWISDV